jgi:chromosome segregation ATPase
MADDDANGSFAERLAREGEDTVARLVQDLSENPVVRSLVERAFDARERAAQAQEVALAALNLPSASDIERLTRRIRSVSLRMEGLEDGVDRLDERLATLAGRAPTIDAGDLDRRLSAIELRLESIAGNVAALAGRQQPASSPRAAAAKKPAAKKPAAKAAQAPRRQPARAARPR